MAIRNIVHIQLDKCDGCGLCIPSCEEGAIQIVDGKASVVSDVYCDGLGNCLGHCPQDAISIIQREAEAFDVEAVSQHLAMGRADSSPAACKTGCPGSKAVHLEAAEQDGARAQPAQSEPLLPSRLTNWPVQLHLVPPNAPYFQRADLQLVADCVPFACANFHTRILDGRPVVIGCPKLDDCHFYVEKLAAIIQQSQIQGVSVVHMEVPCCTSLVRIADAAIKQASVSIPLRDVVVTTHGEIAPCRIAQPAPAADSRPNAPDSQLPIL